MSSSAETTATATKHAAATGAAAQRLSLRAVEQNAGAWTPAGLQRRSALAARRWGMLGLCLVSLAAVLWGAALALGGDGWTTLDVGLWLCVALSAPWTVFGFWTGAVGFALKRLYGDPTELVAPHWADADRPAQITERTAVLMTLRNEDPDRAFRRLLALRADLDRAGFGDRYDLFVLSDSSKPEVAAREERLFAANRAALDGFGRAHYRRRPVNKDYKAGNIRDWVDQWGDRYAFMAPLDADSAISGEALLKLQRVCERHPRIGLLQALALNAPGASPFARLFQFGARLGHRVHAVGASWWQGDSGPFWGHNALIRVDPFKRWCKLPKLKGAPPLGGPILSHDQVEAALMRRGGYEVRLAPVELDSYEEAPVTTLDFLKRETRWANGNLQYGPLLGMARLRPANRFQLFAAMMNYLAPTAWMLMMLLAAGKLVEPAWTQPTPEQSAAYDARIAMALFFAMMALSLAPKLFGALDTMMTRGGVARFGGVGRFSGSLTLEILFGMLLAPIAALRIAVFVVGLPFGKKLDWGGQNRDAYALDWGVAVSALKLQLGVGIALTAAMAALAPMVLPWAAPVLLGWLLAAPFAVVTASPALGAWMARRRLAASPEEIAPPPILAALETVRLETAPAVPVPAPATPRRAAS